MAATQAEKQQNDVNTSEKVQPEQHLNLRNTLLQNGTEKSNVRGSGVVVGKTKASGTKNIGIEMSQYRQDGGVSGPGPCPASDQPLNSGPGLESDMSGGTEVNAYPATTEGTAGGGVGGNGGTGDGNGSAMQAYGFQFGPRGNYNPNASTDQHSLTPTTGSNSSDSSMLQAFGQFGPGAGPQGIRHSFTGNGAKQPMIGPRPTGVGVSAGTGAAGPGSEAGAGPVSGVFSQHQQQQRFISGQSISQPTGPTPTLNQLLQSSNQVRYQNSYSHSDQIPYGQSWATQKPLASYGSGSVTAPVTGYRNQATVSSTFSPFNYPTRAM